jgi:hypothetical protein
MADICNVLLLAYQHLFGKLKNNVHMPVLDACKPDCMLSKKELAVMQSLVDVQQRVANEEVLLMLHQKESNSRLPLGCFDAFVGSGTIILFLLAFLCQKPP